MERSEFSTPQEQSTVEAPTTPSMSRTPQGSPPLQGERVAFTGTLASMPHKQAHAIVEQHGGTATQHVSRQTTLLVIGDEGWPLEPDGHPSVKLQQAQQLQEQGLPIRILGEAAWLKWIGLSDQPQEVRRMYTPAMLSQMLDVSVNVIRGWARVGLIRPVRRVFRLPYFDFQEVTSARQLTQLLQSGVPRHRLEDTLLKLRSVLPHLQQPIGQLELLAGDDKIVLRDEKGLLDARTGQRLLDFDVSDQKNIDAVGGRENVSDDSSDEDPDQGNLLSMVEGDAEAERRGLVERLAIPGQPWREIACRHLDEHRFGAAIEALRMALMERPDDAELQFYLADALYRSDLAQAALERYYCAVECDHEYIEAWTQLGCLHVELGDPERAVDAFRVAIAIHDEYPDAHWHLAETLCRLGQEEEAAPHWRRYLEFDANGPWAETARQHLEAT